MSQQSLAAEAQRQVTAAGYLATREYEVKTLGKRTACIDLVAWAPNETGDLVPSFIVEVKEPGKGGHVDRALQQLQFYKPLLEVENAYVFDGEWYLATQDLTSAARTNIPLPDRGLGTATASIGLLNRLIFEVFNKNRDQPVGTGTVWVRLLALLAAQPGGAPGQLAGVPRELLALAQNPANRVLLAEVMAEQFERLDRFGGEGTTTRSLARAMARLLAAQDGWTVVDPFCGLGGCLRAVSEHAQAKGRTVRLQGLELNGETAENAARLLHLAGTDAEIRVQDSFSVVREAGADGVIAAPPINMRLRQAVSLGSGGLTQDGNIAAVDCCASLLRPGGRAVLLLAPSFFFTGGLVEHYRTHLQTTRRIVAVIELPPKLLSNTAIKTVLLVIENAPPTDSLVARLEEDWEEQLDDGGDFFAAYQRHLGEGG